MAVPVIVGSLLKAALPTLAGAVLAKGQEVVEKKLGVKLDDMLGTEAGRIELKKLEMQHEEFLINAALEEKRLDIQADSEGQKQVTDRWRFDMASDSWLAKNVRPAVLVYLTGCVTIMAFLSGVQSTFRVEPKWIDLLETVLVIVYSAYFIGRTAEKSANLWRKK